MSNKEISLILPTTGEPLVLHYWLENLKTYRHLISNVFVSVDCMGKLNPMEYQFIENYLRRQLCRHGGIRESFHFVCGQHGLNIKHLLNNFELDLKDTVLLMEEDDYILNVNKFEQAVNTHFDEGYDITGYGRESCGRIIAEALYRHVHLRSDLKVSVKEEENQYALNFWPTLFLAKKHLLLKSSQNFCAHTWPSGSTLNLGDQSYTMPHDVAGDTMVAFSVELYSNPLVKKVKLLDNIYHSRLEDKDCLPPVMDTSINFHAGSLSTVLANKFWKPNQADAVKGGYIDFLKNHNNSPIAHIETMDLYRRLNLLQQMLYSLKNPKDFEFFHNYETNIQKTLDLMRSVGKIEEIIPKFGIEAIKNGLDTSIYANVFKKMI